MTHWMQIKTLSDTQMPSPRWGHSMCAVDKNIYLFGGYQNSKYFNDLWKFNLTTLKFTQIEQQGQIPPPCSNFTMNLSEDQTKIILFGGGTLNKEKLNTVYQLNIATHTWEKLSVNSEEPQPWNRSYHCSEIIGNYFIVFGGEFFHDLDDLWLFDLKNKKWMEIKMEGGRLKPTARKFASSFKYQNKFYVVAGCHSKYESLSDAYYLDFNLFLETNNVEDLQWNDFKLSNNEIISRWGHVSVVKKHKAYIFAGRQGSKDLQNLVSIDLITSECKQISIVGDLPKGRRKPALCLRNNTLFCHSGFDGNYVKDFFEINLLERPTMNQKQQKKLEVQKIDQFKLQSNREKLARIQYSTNFLKIQKSQFRDQVESLLTNNPPSMQEFATLCAQSKLLNNNRYFEIFKNQHFRSQKFITYRSQNMKDQKEYAFLIQTFLLYLKYGKLLLAQCSTEEQKRLLENLYELADYYCLFHLQYIIKEYLLSDFQKNLRSKRGQIKKLVQNALLLQKYDAQIGEYAGFQSLAKLIKVSNIPNISDLKAKFKHKAHIKQIGWLLSLLDNFAFELQQIAMSKTKNQHQCQNDIPELNHWGNNQKISQTPLSCLNFFGIF